MASRRVEEFAYLNNISFRKAKKMLGKKRNSEQLFVHANRGAPIAGTGKPKGAKT